MGKTTGSHMRIMVILLSAAVLAGFASCCRDNGNGVPPAGGYALAIGLNQVDPAHYAGWNGQLYGCEPDANDMAAIASSEGLTVETLLTARATRENVLGELSRLAETLQPGNLLVVSYSGHGGQVPDLNGDEDDGLDETWCLYDGELIDDELYGAWMKFRPGVRILVFSDSCHSGTVLKMKKADMENPPASRTQELDKSWKALRVPPRLDRARILSSPAMRDAVTKRPYLRERIGRLAPATPAPNVAPKPLPPAVEAEEVLVSRSMPPGVSLMTYTQNQQFYDQKGRAAPKEDPKAVQASLILISGCADDQTSADIGYNGLFTWMLKQVWNHGAFTGSHPKFHTEIRKRVIQENSDQVPDFSLEGTPDQTFVDQRPYKGP
jgi:hypothetical protein